MHGECMVLHGDLVQRLVCFFFVNHNYLAYFM